MNKKTKTIATSLTLAFTLAAGGCATTNNFGVGYKVSDDTIYAGISPDTHKVMFAAPADLPTAVNFDTAAKQCADLEVGGVKGFHVPTAGELDVLFQNRETGALKGTFNPSGGSYYWSSTPRSPLTAYNQEFSTGDRGTSLRYIDSSVRCVRPLRLVPQQ